MEGVKTDGCVIIPSTLPGDLCPQKSLTGDVNKPIVSKSYNE